MTEKRMISTGLPDSEKLMDCSSDTVRLLFVWLCLSVDDDGKMQGRARTIKKKFFGDRDNIKVSNCEKMLEELSSLGLIIYYRDIVVKNVVSINDYKCYIEIPKWTCINKVRKDMHKPSEILSFSEGVHELVYLCNVPVTKPLHRLDKVRLDKDRLDKSRYAKNVYLLLSEYQSLLEKDFKGDEQKLKEGIDKLDAYKESNGKTYKSDAGAMRSWVAKEIMEEEKPKTLIIKKESEWA